MATLVDKQLNVVADDSLDNVLALQWIEAEADELQLEAFSSTSCVYFMTCNPCK